MRTMSTNEKTEQTEPKADPAAEMEEAKSAFVKAFEGKVAAKGSVQRAEPAA